MYNVFWTFVSEVIHNSETLPASYKESSEKFIIWSLILCQVSSLSQRYFVHFKTCDMLAVYQQFSALGIYIIYGLAGGVGCFIWYFKNQVSFMELLDYSFSCILFWSKKKGVERIDFCYGWGEETISWVVSFKKKKQMWNILCLIIGTPWFWLHLNINIIMSHTEHRHHNLDR